MDGLDFHLVHHFGASDPDTLLATSIDTFSMDVILLGIILHPVTLPIIFMDEKSRLVKFMRVDPPSFNRDPRVDAYEFLVDCHERLHRLGLLDSNGVDFTIF